MEAIDFSTWGACSGSCDLVFSILLYVVMPMLSIAYMYILIIYGDKLELCKKCGKFMHFNGWIEWEDDYENTHRTRSYKCANPDCEK